MIYEQAKNEYNAITNRIQCIQNELKNLPSGKLVCCSHKKYTKWYQSNSHEKTYIPKSNRSLAEQLAKKKYLSLLLQDLEKEKTALSFYLRHHSTMKQSEQLLTSSSEYQKLLAPCFTPLSQELATWMSSPYEHNLSHPETLIHKGVSNYFLRSKSEVLIDMLLRTHHIPFRYECALELNGSVLFPDFTIRHPQTGGFIYWEHFGLMDNVSYIDNAVSKIRLYATNGIIPGIQLITTFETKNNPLDIETIEKTIEFYLK
ncbi:MAG: ATPase [Acetatifactor sp.]